MIVHIVYAAIIIALLGALIATKRAFAQNMQKIAEVTKEKEALTWRAGSLLNMLIELQRDLIKAFEPVGFESIFISHHLERLAPGCGFRTYMEPVYGYKPATLEEVESSTSGQQYRSNPLVIGEKRWVLGIKKPNHEKGSGTDIEVKILEKKADT